MNAGTIDYTGRLIVLSCWCGIKHAVPQSLRDEQMRQHNAGKQPLGICCPLGHTHMPSGRSETERLRDELKWQRDRAASAIAARDQAEASARAYKGAATKARKRAAAALCPCCNRSFVQLRRHMETKHSDYDPRLVRGGPIVAPQPSGATSDAQ